MLASVKGSLWMMPQEHVEAFALSALEAREGIELDVEDFYNVREESSIDEYGVAHIHIQGALLDNSPAVYEKLGLVTRYSTITGEVEESIRLGAEAVMFHVNSPGGTVAGNVEAANYIASIELPTMAHCQGMACSAAYKISAGCDLIVATESAEVGNIGTILSWADCTEFWRDMGIEMKALTSKGADLKSTFHVEPDATQLAFLQERIDKAGEKFRNHVSAYRDVDDEVFRAGWYSGEDAISLGLIDAIGSDEDALQMLINKL